MLDLNIWHIFLYLCSCNKSIKHEVVDVVKEYKKEGEKGVELKVIEKKIKNVTIRLCCCIRHRVIKQATRIDLIVAFDVSNVRLSSTIFCQYKEIDLWLEKLGLCCEKQWLAMKTLYQHISIPPIKFFSE